jgi:hypothetical protein
MLRKVLVAALAIAIVAGGVLWPASTEAAPSGIGAASNLFQVAQAKPKKKKKHHKKKHHKKKKKKTAATAAVAAIA